MNGELKDRSRRVEARDGRITPLPGMRTAPDMQRGNEQNQKNKAAMSMKTQDEFQKHVAQCSLSSMAALLVTWVASEKPWAQRAGLAPQALKSRKVTERTLRHQNGAKIKSARGMARQAPTGIRVQQAKDVKMQKRSHQVIENKVSGLGSFSKTNPSADGNEAILGANEPILGRNQQALPTADWPSGRAGKTREADSSPALYTPLKAVLRSRGDGGARLSRSRHFSRDVTRDQSYA